VEVETDQVLLRMVGSLVRQWHWSLASPGGGVS
jgi:hypothetical protein